MNVEINYLGVLLAMVSSMVVGSIWYSKSVFGEKWAKLVKLNDKKMSEGATKAIVTTIIVSLITAYVLAHVAFLSNKYFANSFFQDAVTTAFWLWLGLVAARFITHDAFEQRPRQLTLLTIGNEFVTLILMGVVIGWIGPA